MITADQAADLLRPDLREKVQRMKRDGVDKMDAYGAIGGALGRSAVWVRRVAGHDGRAAVHLRDVLNFYAWAQGISPAAAYGALCAKIEAVSEAVEHANDSLRGRRHADDPSAGAPALGAADAASRGGGMVPPVAREGRS